MQRHFNMVLLAVYDSRYCFSLVDTGEYGSNNEHGNKPNSKIGKIFGNGQISIPESQNIRGDDSRIIGGSAGLAGHLFINSSVLGQWTTLLFISITTNSSVS